MNLVVVPSLCSLASDLEGRTSRASRGGAHTPLQRTGLLDVHFFFDFETKLCVSARKHFMNEKIAILRFETTGFVKIGFLTCASLK